MRGALLAREVEATYKDDQERDADNGQVAIRILWGCIHNGLVGLRLRIALPGLLDRFSSASVARANGHSMGCGGNCQLGILLPIKMRGETFSALHARWIQSPLIYSCPGRSFVLLCDLGGFSLRSLRFKIF